MQASTGSILPRSTASAHSEEVIAKSLVGISPRPYIFTKCGLVWNGRGQVRRSLRRESILQEAEASLRRLRVDALDLYQIHWPDPDAETQESCETLLRLKEEGKVRAIGVCNFSVTQMRRAQGIAPVNSLQPPHSLIARDAEKEILAYASTERLGVIVYSPMRSGLLSGATTCQRIAALPADDFRKYHAEFQEPKLSRNLALAEVLRTIGNRHGQSAGEVAIAWTLHHPAITGAIVGVCSAAQVKGILGAADFRLRAAELEEIETFLKENEPGHLRTQFRRLLRAVGQVASQ